MQIVLTVLGIAALIGLEIFFRHRRERRHRQRQLEGRIRQMKKQME